MFANTWNARGKTLIKIVSIFVRLLLWNFLYKYVDQIQSDPVFRCCSPGGSQLKPAATLTWFFCKLTTWKHLSHKSSSDSSHCLQHSLQTGACLLSPQECLALWHHIHVSWRTDLHTDPSPSLPVPASTSLPSCRLGACTALRWHRYRKVNPDRAAAISARLTSVRACSRLFIS